MLRAGSFAGTASIAADSELDLWINAPNARNLKSAFGFGRPLEIQRRHYWWGVPEFHSQCRNNGMQRKRRQLAEGYLTGDQLARKLGIGRTTLNRSLKAGKLPKPTRSIGGMLLFDRAAVTAAVS